MNTVKVRDIEIGAGAPKIIVPIVGVTKKDIIDEAKTFDSIPVDVVEWRVDWFEHVFEFDKVEEVLKELREALGNIPLSYKLYSSNTLSFSFIPLPSSIIFFNAFFKSLINSFMKPLLLLLFLSNIFKSNISPPIFLIYFLPLHN